MSELDKLLKVKDKSQIIGEFLVWCNSEGIFLASWVEENRFEPRAARISESIEQILARYFDIDLVEAEKERVKILADWREKARGKSK